MTRANLSAPPETRIVAASLALLLHMVMVFLLLHAFAPGFTAQVVDGTLMVFTVAETRPSPEPKPRAPDKGGASGEAGRKAVPRPQMPPLPPIDLSRRNEAAPLADSTGSAVTSGAQAAGEGTGAMGPGNGPGAGAGGMGQGGGGAATPLVKIAGDINSAHDFPREGRALRNGDYVVIELSVGTDGRAHSCRVQRASRDAEADEITCHLAVERFRFRPRTNASGNPVPATYLWQQRWWDPRDNKN